jgi:hypothetical protein
MLLSRAGDTTGAKTFPAGRINLIPDPSKEPRELEAPPALPNPKSASKFSTTLAAYYSPRNPSSLIKTHTLSYNNLITVSSSVY